MPQYFFDIADGGFTVDETGLALDSLESARAHAIAALPDIARQYLPDGSTKTYEVRVRDADGRPLFKAALAFSCEMLV